MMREGLAQLFANQPDLEVCGEAGDANEALEKIASLKPDLVLTDITLPGKNGLELTKDIQAMHPGVLVLVISMHDEALYVERVLRAVAQAHRATGVPITTHTPRPPEPWGLHQQRIFKEEGVDLSRVVIGHSGGTLNTDYHLELIENGSFLGFDHFGTGGFTLEERVDAVVRLCERGCAERIVLSHDAMCFVDWFPRSLMEAAQDWRWTYIPIDVLPVMRARGLRERDIQRMMVENPRTILEGGAPY